MLLEDIDKYCKKDDLQYFTKIYQHFLKASQLIDSRGTDNRIRNIIKLLEKKRILLIEKNQDSNDIFYPESEKNTFLAMLSSIICYLEKEPPE